MKELRKEEIKDKKQIKRELRNLQSGESIHIIGWGYVERVTKTYAMCGEVDDSDLQHDYDAWTYGWKMTWVADLICKELQLA